MNNFIEKDENIIDAFKNKIENIDSKFVGICLEVDYIKKEYCLKDNDISNGILEIKKQMT